MTFILYKWLLYPWNVHFVKNHVLKKVEGKGRGEGVMKSGEFSNVFNTFYGSRAEIKFEN